MTQPVPIQSPPKKASGFWTPWGNVRVPDLDAALEKKQPRPVKRGTGAALTAPKPAEPVRR